MSDRVVFYVGILWVAILLGLLVIRLARSSTAAQRIVALDLLTLLLIGLLALAAGGTGRAYALDAAVALALLSFVATFAAARYYERRRPFE